MANIAYLSLGSNVGDRAANLREALSRLSKAGKIVAVSSIYETAPVEFTAQPDFYNLVAAAEVEPGTTAEMLLREILAVEKAMGRVRAQDKGPRNIDIDILLFGDQVIDTAQLTVPHPAMHERRFVLVPLAEIAPSVMHPKLDKTITELLKELQATEQEVRRAGPM